MRAALTLLLILGATLLGGVAHANTLDWFENEGESTLQSFAPTVFPDMSEEERASLTIGAPVPFTILGPDATDLRPTDPEPTNHIAPVLLGDDVVGVISHSDDEEMEESDRVVADAKLGEMIGTMEAGDLLFQDTVLTGHYIARGDEVIPASEEAINRLAGSTSIDMFLDLRAEIVTEGPTKEEESVRPESGPIVLASIILSLFLFFTLVLTWLRRAPHEPPPVDPVRRHFREVRFYRRGGNRVDTDD